MEITYGSMGQGKRNEYLNGVPKYIYHWVIVMVNGKEFEVKEEEYFYNNKETLIVRIGFDAYAEIKTEYIIYKYVYKEINYRWESEKEKKLLKENK